MKKVIVYTLHYCPYCRWVKELLEREDIPFEEIDFTDNDDLRAEIAEKSGQTTAPQVFVGDRSLGGYEDVKKLRDSGELKKLLS